ncbi:MAG TPA: glycosyltransferase family 4 protein [Thermomicrobiales bacterium]|nr:glycosyltransferase family 4 protein [Thermomicrobiales bacterium]
MTTSLAVGQAGPRPEEAGMVGVPGLARQRIWIISDDLSGPPDEGVKKFTHAIAVGLGAQHDVALISTHGEDAAGLAQAIPAGRHFLSRQLRAALRDGHPEYVIYATRRSATFFSFLRARLLKLYCPGARVVLLGLQTRRHPGWQQQIIRRIRPDLVIAQSDDNCAYLAGLGCRVALTPGGVDTETFQPVDTGRRAALREQYGLAQDRPVILHVGHLQEGRGVRALIPLAASGECQVVLVASSSTAQEEQLAAELRAAGVRIVSEYLPRIEELYQLADCYVFPVTATDNAIEAPLSVLEALACDLPVVMRRFGGLPRLFGRVRHPGLRFVDSDAELAARAIELARAGTRGTRAFAMPFSWSHTSRALLAELLDLSNDTT